MVSTWLGLSQSLPALTDRRKSSTLAREQRQPHKTKAIELLDEGMRFPLKSEYDRVNFMLEGLRQTSPPSLLELAGLEEAAVRVVPHGDRWFQMGKHWMRIQVIPHDAVFHTTVGRRWSGPINLDRHSHSFHSWMDIHDLALMTGDMHQLMATVHHGWVLQFY